MDVRKRRQALPDGLRCHCEAGTEAVRRVGQPVSAVREPREEGIGGGGCGERQVCRGGIARYFPGPG